MKFSQVAFAAALVQAVLSNAAANKVDLVTSNSKTPLKETFKDSPGSSSSHQAVKVDSGHELGAAKNAAGINHQRRLNDGAEEAGYTLLYTLDIPDNPNYSSSAPAYTEINSLPASFLRVAYRLQLDDDYTWVSMDAFTDDAARIGVPCFNAGCYSGAAENPTTPSAFWKDVSNVNVDSNKAGLTGSGYTGRIEFGPSNYGGIDDSDTIADHIDAPHGEATANGYGGMQVHVNGLESGGVSPYIGTIFAFNRFQYGSSCDLGIGNRDQEHPDWTFAQNCPLFTTKTLKVYVSDASWAPLGDSPASTEGPTSSPTNTPTKQPTDSPTKSPSDAPTKSPSDAPTKSPTDAPTKTITQSPSTSPTRTPWDITFQSIITNFGLNSTNQLVVDYRVGKQTFASKLYAGGCKSTSSENTAIDNIDVSETLTSDDDTDGMKNITLSYSFDTANITTSNIWSTENNATKIELCQVAQLTAVGPGGDAMVITEDMRNITIDFDLDVDFEIEGGVDLAGATIEAEQQNTSLSDFITAFKCGGEFGSAEDSGALAPNTELHVCIKSESDEVIINEIVSMQIDGRNPEGNPSSLPVIANDAAIFPTFTTLSFATPKPNEAIVTTRVPTNMFNFEATDANIAVSGALTVKLDDGTRRRLTISKPYRALQDAGNEAAFDLTIELQPDADAGLDLEGEGAMMNSAEAAASKGFAVLGMMTASAYALW